MVTLLRSILALFQPPPPFPLQKLRKQLGIPRTPPNDALTHVLANQESA